MARLFWNWVIDKKMGKLGGFQLPRKRIGPLLCHHVQHQGVLCDRKAVLHSVLVMNHLFNLSHLLGFEKLDGKIQPQRKDNQVTIINLLYTSEVENDVVINGINDGDHSSWYKSATCKQILSVTNVKFSVRRESDREWRSSLPDY